MKIEKSLNPNCSEAVFRFYTLEPKKIQTILQAIADEISANTDFKPHKKQIVPLFKTAEEYDTKWNSEETYNGKVRDKYENQLNKIWKDRDLGIITQEEAVEKYGEIKKKMSKEIYPRTLLKACAGLGDNEAVITIETDSFVLNIGNNDLSDKTDWTEKIKDLGIKVRYAGDDTPEGNKLDKKYARDCTCGCTYNL